MRMCRMQSHNTGEKQVYMKNCKRQDVDITFDSLVRQLNKRSELKANAKLGKVRVKKTGGNNANTNTRKNTR